MTRDIRDRLELFMGGLEIRRLALNKDQVDQYNPPPNPAKLTDSRIGAYLRDHGDESWELDALEPRVLVDLIRTEITELLDQDEWDRATQDDDDKRTELGRIAERYDDVTTFLQDEE